ncbi:P-loop containing nucleoside triphosphate hydrolase protein [Schizophyllum commune H4-8]|uniref:RNA helicase n=1 Tax=Schizophyllum commune (strain H4-8 / FGSC 9210) TaxID=578458 RepID=D8PZR6_SCHCM|nr:P-loop containing nucleoside triphosphate hydrolase protein [Schizophyllum commune H4-8]KAI5896491.1 P-loop containing nucleoside triphosphate hydrolase protein [Schizophyllum commune H4-8]
MGHLRERYNAKARQSSVGGKKKAKRARGAAEADALADTNADIVTPKTDEEKERERKERMKEQLIAESDSKWNAKKKKRLEKYIDKKLKQEERVHLFEKLAKSQSEVSNVLQLQSSATLGTRKPITHEDVLAQEEDKEVRRAFDSRPGKRRRLDGPAESGDLSSSEDEDVGMDGSVPMRAARSRSSSPQPIIVEDQPFQPQRSVAQHEPVVGGALQRNADGTPVAPIVKKRGTKTKFQSWRHTGRKSVPAQQEDSDSSFDSSDSAFDSDEDEEGDLSEDDGRVAAEEGGDDDDEEGDSEDESSEDDEPAPPPKRKSLGFKAWATQQLNAAKGYTAPTDASGANHTAEPPASTDPAHNDTTPPPPPKKRKRGGPQEKIGPLGEELVLPATSFAAQFPSASANPFKMSAITEPAPFTSTSQPSASSQPISTSQPTSTSAPQSLPARFVPVTRPSDVQEARLQLPVVAEEQPIMEAIRLHPVVVLCGETGSGKTTQVPQFLYEAGFGAPDSENPGMIGVTQPRRVAAMAMARRVAHELGVGVADVGEEEEDAPSPRKSKKLKSKSTASSSMNDKLGAPIAYQIRYAGTAGPATRIKFMTDGVLLRELAIDFLLTKYSVIIIDEAHERSMNTDILIGVLSRVVRLREEMWKEGREGAKPLRLIIMSATLRVSDFAANTTLFPSPPPVISIPARQHPVTVHFARRTQSDYVSEAIKKVVKIHARLPPGGVLVFLTGQSEIVGVARRLEARYGRRAVEERRARKAGGKPSRAKEDERFKEIPEEGTSAAQADVEAENVDLGNTHEDLAADVDGDGDQDMDPDALDTDDEDELDAELGLNADECDVPMHIVPLYALLPSARQMEVFKPPPPGTRLVVLATNVAETSLTIPNIRYVVDTGRAKERRYDPASGVQSFPISWISKASAAQRAGRAGRTGPGHCYRLYSSALFENHFDEFGEPEVLRAPVDGLVLQMKAMHIDTVAGFPFPTPPDRLALARAERVLARLGALSSGTGSGEGRITELGRTMALFPLTPRFARMLASGGQHGCMPYVICLVSALSVGDPFLREEGLLQDDEEDADEGKELTHLSSAAAKAKEVRRLRRKAFFEKQHIYGALGDFTSDLFKVLSVVGAYEYAGGGHKFCTDNFVRPKAMEEIHKLRSQLSHIVQNDFPDIDVGFVAKLKPPSDKQLKVLRQLLAAGFIDQVAVRKDRLDSASSGGTQYTNCRGVPYRAIGIEEDVFIHPSSVVHDHRPPEYVVFNEVVRTSKIWLKGITVVNPAWLASIGKGSMCTYSKPKKNRAGEDVVIPHFGPDGWELPPVKASLVAS